MGGSKTSSKTQSTQTSKPLDWQSDAIQDLFKNAQGVYSQQAAAGAPNYDVYQGLNDDQKTALNNIIGSASNSTAQGQNIASLGQVLAGVGTQGGLATVGQATGNAASGAAGNFNQGSTAASTALSNNMGTSLGNYNNALSSALSAAGIDPTQSNINNAQAYANSSGIKQAVQDTLDQSNDIYLRGTVPSLNAQATSGGNLNSSRAGAASAVADAMQAKNNAATASNMYLNAYNQGLTTSENARQANLSGLLSGAGTALSGVNSALSGQQASNEQTNANNQLAYNYNGQLSGLGSSLLGAATSGADMTQTGNTLINTGNQNAYTAATQYQNAAQNAANSALNNTTQQNAYQWGLLNNLYSLIGANNWGSQTDGTQTTETKTTPSAMSQVMSGIGAVAGLAGSVMSGGLTSAIGGLAGSAFGGSGTSAGSSYNASQWK